MNISKIDTSILKLSKKDPVTNENLIQQVESLNGNIKTIFEKINNMNSNINALISKEGGDDDKIHNPNEVIGSEDIIRKIKKDIKSQYTELSDFQIVNNANEKKFSKFEALIKDVNEKIEAKNVEGLKKMNEINAKILKIDMETKDIQSKVTSALQEIGDLNSSAPPATNIEEKKKDESQISMSQIKPEENTNIMSKINSNYIEISNSDNISPHSGKKELKESKISSTLKDLVNKNADFQIQINLLKQKVQNSTHQDPINENELVEKIKDIINSNEKIASKLDVKTLKAVVDDLISRFENLKKDYEINVIQSKEKAPAQIIEEMKQSIVSLDNRGSLISKNLKVLEMRINEMSSFPQTERVVEKDGNSTDKIDGKIEAITDDFNEKIASIRDSITDLKNDYNRFTHVVDSKVDGKVGKDDIIYLEGKIYKELDRIVSTLTKKIYSKADSTRLADIESKLRRLMFEVFESGISQRETKEEAMFTKKPLGGISCASCEKEVTNAFAERQKDLFNAWNKFPQKDIENLQSKLYPNIRKKKKKDEQLSLSEQKAKNFLEMQSKLSYLGHPINKSREELLINENDKSRSSLPLLKQNTLKE